MSEVVQATAEPSAAQHAVRSNSHYGKACALVRLGAYVFAIALGIAALFLDWNDKDTYAVVAVGGSAYCILAVWSIFLAWRALRKAERAAWPVMIALMTMADFSAFLIVTAVWPYRTWSLLKVNPSLLWAVDILYYLILPVFVPFVTLVAIVTVPLAFKLVRRAEARSKEAWTRARRWRWGVRMLCAAALLSGIFILPVPLFLFCATAPTAGRINRYGYGEPPGYQALLAANMPTALKDATDSILHLFWSSKPGRLLYGLRARVVCEHVSEERAAQLIRGSDRTLASFGWMALSERFPKRSNEEVEAALNSKRGSVPWEASQHYIMTAMPDRLINALHNGLASGAWLKHFIFQRAQREPAMRSAMEEYVAANPKTPLSNDFIEILSWVGIDAKKQKR